MRMKRFFLLLIILASLLTFGIAEENSDIIQLHLSFEPADIEQVFLLPNGSFLVDYYTVDTSDFWRNLGRDDVLNHISEIVDPLGNSVWYFRDSGDILPEDLDNHLFQYMILSDCFIREFYTAVSMEEYYKNVWDFEGRTIENNIDSILQEENEIRYIFSMYPFVLEVWPRPQGDREKNALLTDCTDNSSVELEYCYGSRATFTTDQDFYLLYEAQNTDKLLWYNGNEKQTYYYSTNLDRTPGILLKHDSTLYVLFGEYQGGELSYSLFSCPCPRETDDRLSFEPVGNFSMNDEFVVDSIFIVDNVLYLVAGDLNDNFYIAHFDGKGILIDHKLKGKISCFENSAGPIHFLISDKPGKENLLMTVSRNNYQDFLMYFDQPQ